MAWSWVRLEGRTPKDAWRGPSEISRKYLGFLSANGYTLAEVEQASLGRRSADELQARLTGQ
ncbi:hypothetical protein [Mycolicibacter icosiumassiliensis]|uniref:hypothetical protein n=1 Tax=Mycolicibacter icosiumassiliensis TaxID=1792835 RepID=UPI0012B6A0A0|nr:hypothetical protein [Mycolicibacter icosiumassiliensis]